jgi:hypothetical protein
MANKIPLSEVLEHVAGELVEADRKARARGFEVMQFGECEIEFAIETEKSGSGGVQVWVLELGGEIKRSEVNTIRIKFTSNPQHPVGAPARESGAARSPVRQQRKRSTI